MRSAVFRMANTAVGARGYKVTGVAHRDFGRWGDHRLNAFFSDQQSWNQSNPLNAYELDASGNPVQSLANLSNAESGRTVMPAMWVPAFARTLIGGGQWPVQTVFHPVT
jgi:hypothetical protein